MSVTFTVVTVLLSALLILTAIRKLSHRPRVVASYARAGVPEEWLNPLAALLLAATAGLLAGLAWQPLAVATAVALTVYFLVAIAFHLRVGDHAQLATPVAFETVTLAVLILALL